MKSKPILVEEPHAYFLIKSMGLSKREIIIQPGKPKIGSIIKKMVEKNLINFNFIIVDENTNKNSHSIFKKFKTIQPYNKYGLIVQKYSNIYLVLFENKLAKWLLKTSLDCEIDLKKLGLSKNVEEFDKEIKGIIINPKFRRLVEEMIEKNCISFVFLKELILNRNDIPNFIKLHS